MFGLGGVALAQSGACAQEWLPTFGEQPGTGQPGLFGVTAFATFDDGTGPALYAGGTFSHIGGAVSRGIAKWDGSSWTMVGLGLSGVTVIVNAMEVFDDGSGPLLYVGGEFSGAGGTSVTNLIAWDGSTWTSVGTNGEVRALEVFDDGTGPALYAGGSFTRAGGMASNGIAKWDGASWSALGTGVMEGASSGTVRALEVFDGGSGAELYVGGGFDTAGGVAASRLARWDGTNWSTVGAGIDPYSGVVLSLCVLDDGTSEVLYIGGIIPGGNVARWNGSNLIVLTGLNDDVRALAVFDDGTGPALYAGGGFTMAGGTTLNGIAKRVGSSWQPVGAGVGGTFGAPTVRALGTFDDGSGEALFAGGDFVRAGDVSAPKIAKWNGSNWSALGTGLDGQVSALTTFDDGTGRALYAGGFFATAGGVQANRVAKWDGSNWAALGGGIDDRVRALAVFDDGNGDALYAGGFFTTANGVPVNRVAKWDGANWVPLGFGTNGTVYSLTVYDDGGGAALYVGGAFTEAGGQPASRVAKWDGTGWSSVGAGADNIVRALVVFDDGGGPELIAAGTFMNAGGAAASRVAKWNGTNWARLGAGVTSFVTSLLVFDDGLGDALYLGGAFSTAGLAPAESIAKWDGSNWSPLGSGVNSTVHALTSFDDGASAAVYAAGSFTVAGGTLANRIAKWDGANWTALGTGVTHTVFSLAVFDDGGGDALYAGGSFAVAGDSGDSYLAKWGCPSTQFSSSCNGDGGNQGGCTNCPCSNNAAPGTIGGCLNSASTSARLIADGNPSVNLLPGGSSDLRFSLTSAQPNAFCLLTSGDSIATTNPASPCFGLDSGTQAIAFDGLRCAVGNTRRHGGRPADSNGDVGITNSPWGGEGGPPAGIANAGVGFVAGQTRFFQVIHRDDALAQCMRGLNTSQAVRVVFTPVP